MNASTTPFHW